MPPTSSEEEWRSEYERYEELKKQLHTFTDLTALEVWGEIMRCFVLKSGEIRTGCNFHKSLQQLYKIKLNELKKAQNEQ